MSVSKFCSYFLSTVMFSFFVAAAAHPQDANSQSDSTKKDGEGKTTAASTGDASKGEAIYQQNCDFCHDAKSDEVRVGPGLKGILKKLLHSHKTSDGTEHTDHTVATVRKQIEEGGSGMMPMKDILSKEEIDHIIAYLQTL